VTVTGVDIDELDPALTTGPQHGHDLAQAPVRIEFTAAGAAEPGQMPVRIGHALAMAAATGAPIRIADNLMDRLAVPAQADLAASSAGTCRWHGTAATGRGCSAGTRRLAWQPADDRGR